MRGYYSLLSQQYGSQSDYLGSIPTFIKFLKKYEEHIDQVTKVHYTKSAGNNGYLASWQKSNP